MDTKRRNIQEVNKDKLLKNANRKARRKKEIIKKIKFIVSVAVITLIVVFVLMMTPIFNIKTVGVSGNEMLSIGSIENNLSSLTGKNLFRVSKGEVKKCLEEVPYIEDVEISKKPFPPTLYVKISEIAPAAYVYVDGVRVVIDSQTRVIDDSGSIPSGNIPQVIGITDVKAQKGKVLKIADSEKENAIKTILSSAQDVDVLSKITEIDISNTLTISFKYDNRFEVNCGSAIELDRKIRMFREAINNATMHEESVGTFDLSEPGKAIYTPPQGDSYVENTEEDENVVEDENTDETNTENNSVAENSTKSENVTTKSVKTKSAKSKSVKSE